MSYLVAFFVYTFVTQNVIIMTATETANKVYDYQDYRNLIHALRAEGKSTDGTDNEAFLNYTDLNNARMDKWDKRYQLSDALKAALDNLDHPEDWVVLSEGWCGDAAHSLPIMAKAAKYSDKVNLKILLRDQNLELMDQHLTNGGRAIPKLIRFNLDSGEEMGEWGPRPKPAQAIHLEGKAAGRPKAEVTIDLQKWYARDRGATIDQEFVEILKK